MLLSVKPRVRPRVPVALLMACALLVPVVGAEADPPTQPECLPLGAGTTGVLVVGGEVPSPDQLQGGAGGFGAEASPEVAHTLPERIAFKSQRETFSNEYAFALRGGRIYVRRAEVGVGEPGDPWRVLELPGCLDGRVTAISADYRFLVALGPGRQVYSHDMPGGDLSPERWTWRWGPYFWTGSGLTMPEDVRRFATSELNSAETFTDTSGRQQHPLGVGTVYLLRGDDRRITYLDPWLPQDQSREVCGPQRGTTALAGIDASGSTVFVVSERGELYTRLYDFDVSGANTVFGDYSWERGRPASDTRWQLPGPRWARQAAPPGQVTDRISIARTGSDAADRLLRVEGRTRVGRTGYWQKRVFADRWRFVRTADRPRGRLLPLPDDHPAFTPDDRTFAGSLGGRRTVLRDFNPECSPARLDVRVARGVWLRLLLHSSDGMRQSMREPGLTDVPREYNGAIEVPRRTWRALDHAEPSVRDWVSSQPHRAVHDRTARGDDHAPQVPRPVLAAHPRRSARATRPARPPTRPRRRRRPTHRDAEGRPRPDALCTLKHVAAVRTSVSLKDAAISSAATPGSR